MLSNFITKSHRGFLSVEVVGLNTTAEISKELFLIIAGLGMPLMVYFLHSSSTAEVIELVRFVCLSVSQPSHDQTNCHVYGPENNSTGIGVVKILVGVISSMAIKKSVHNWGLGVINIKRIIDLNTQKLLIFAGFDPMYSYYP